jgi:DNA-binding PadR family transcriptional regulator
MNDLTGIQRDILYSISGVDEPYGLGIKRKLQKYREEDINHGRLYPNLDQLAEKGFVKKRAKDKRTNLYTLTEDGRKAMEGHREWENKQISN